MVGEAVNLTKYFKIPRTKEGEKEFILVALFRICTGSNIIFLAPGEFYLYKTDYFYDF